MREIEVKFKVSDIGAIRQALLARGCVLSEPVEQDDRVYIPRGQTYSDVNAETPILRVRRQATSALLTYKRGKFLNKIEYETAVDHPDAADAIVGKLGFGQALTIKKRRSHGECQGYEVCLDEVEGLGSYVEAESLVEEGEYSEGKTEAIELAMASFLESLGVSKSERVFKGYDILLYEQSIG